MDGERRPIRLLHITTVPQSLGFLRGQCRYMADKGFEVHCVSSTGKMLDDFALSEQVIVHAVQMPRSITPLQDLRAIRDLCRVMKQVRPAIVHAHTPKGGLLGMIAAWFMRVPVRIYNIHGLPMMTASGLKRMLLRLSEGTASALADQVFCVSSSLREVVVSEGLCPSDKIKVLGSGSINGIDADKQFNPERTGKMIRRLIRVKYEIPQNALVIGCVGRIVRDKGMIELMDAWNVLREEYPLLHLLIAGCFEPQDPVPSHIEQMINEDPRVHLTGWITDLPPIYAAMDILAFPTYREGFGLVAIEASAMEIPVVATRIPGCVDAVVDGVTGTLIPPRDSSALTDAIRSYISDPDLRLRHGHAGRERVLRDFRQEEIWKSIHVNYARLLRDIGVDASETDLFKEVA